MRCAAGATTITVTKNEILTSLNKPDDYILAIVEFLDGDRHRVYYVRRPFRREPDFGVTSVNYEFWNSLCPWLNQPKNEIVGNSFGRQAFPMVWDYAEANPLSDSDGNIDKQVDNIVKVLVLSTSTAGVGIAQQADAASQSVGSNKLVSTDPPYVEVSLLLAPGETTVILHAEPSQYKYRIPAL